MTRKPAYPAARRMVRAAILREILIDVRYLDDFARFIDHDERPWLGSVPLAVSEARALMRSLRAWAKEEGSK